LSKKTEPVLTCLCHCFSLHGHCKCKHSILSFCCELFVLIGYDGMKQKCIISLL